MKTGIQLPVSAGWSLLFSQRCILCICRSWKNRRYRIFIGSIALCMYFRKTRCSVICRNKKNSLYWSTPTWIQLILLYQTDAVRRVRVCRLGVWAFGVFYRLIPPYLPSLFPYAFRGNQWITYLIPIENPIPGKPVDRWLIALLSMKTAKVR